MTTPTSGREDAEVQRLRERVAELEAQLGARGPQPPAPEKPRARWRSVTASVLVVLACLLAPLSVVAVWARSQVSDTDRYVQTVAPLAQDPAVQSAVADDVTRIVFQYVDVQGIASDAVAALSAKGLPPRVTEGLQALTVPIANGVQSFTRTEVGKVLASPQFATVWAQANRVAHQQLVGLLSGEQGGALTSQNGTVTLNLGPVVAQVKQRLIADGYSVASRIPDVNRSIVLVQSDKVTKAQGLYRTLNTLGVWLPVIAVVLFAAGVYVAKGHRRTLLYGSLGIVVSMLALGVALSLARSAYLDGVPPDVLPREAASNVFDTLVRFLRTSLRTVAVLGLVLAIGAFFTGPAPTAVRTRSALGRGITAMRGGAEAHGVTTGRFGEWVFRAKRWLRLVVIAIGALVIIFWPYPTGVVIVVTAILVLVGVGLVELLGRPPAAATVPAPRGPQPPSAPPPSQEAREEEVAGADRPSGR